MGAQKDTMVLFAERDLSRFFSERDGWEIKPQNGLKSVGSFYRASRYKWEGNDVAYIAVSFDPVPKEETINSLDIFASGQRSRTKKYLLTPQAADASEIPPHVHILRMDAFAADDGKLVWLTKKKNARKFSQEPAIAK